MEAKRRRLDPDASEDLFTSEVGQSLVASTKMMMKSYLAIPDWQPLETALHDADAVLDRAAIYLAGVRQFRSAIESKYVVASESFKSVPRMVYQTWPELAGDTRRDPASPSGAGSKAAVAAVRSVSSDAGKGAAASPGATAKQATNSSGPGPRSAGDPRRDRGTHDDAGTADPSAATGADTAPAGGDSDADVSNPALESGADVEAGGPAPAGAAGTADSEERPGSADADTEASSQRDDGEEHLDGDDEDAPVEAQHAGGGYPLISQVF